MGLSGAAVSGLMIGSFYCLAPLFAQQREIDLTETSHFMTLTTPAAHSCNGRLDGVPTVTFGA